MAEDFTLSFGPYRLDPANARLWRGVQPVRLTPKAFQVLCYIVERPGQLVSKEELFDAVWPDTVISDATLTSTIQEIRKALQDTPKSPQYLETVPKRGFRFIGDVVRGQPKEARSEELGIRGEQEERLANDNGSLALNIQSLDSETPNGSFAAVHTLDQKPQTLDITAPTSLWLRKGLLFVGLFLLVGALIIVRNAPFSIRNPQSPIPNPEALPLPDKPSLIVLPLVNLSGDPEQEYFSDGLTEVLTGDLSRIFSLFVIARNSAFTYKGKAVKVQDVSKEMGVRYVLEGSVQKANQRVRVNVQLIDATTGYEIWSQQYDRPLTDIFALQDEIVQKIVTTLKLQLPLLEQGFRVRKGTESVEAYDYLLRGVSYYWRTTKETNALARQMYEKALALDPQYAEAYAHIAGTYYIEWLWHWSSDPNTLEQAFTFVQKAIALDDSLSGFHGLLGRLYALKHQYDLALAEGERAIVLDPNSADSYSALTEALNFAGRPEEALRAETQAMRLNPHSPSWYLVTLGWAEQLSGRYTEAVAALQEAIRRNPNHISAYTILADSYLEQWVAQQNPAEQTLEPALAAVQRALSFNDLWHANHILLGYIHLYQRQYDQALAEVERAVALAPNDADSYAALGVVLSSVGRTEDALKAATQALHLTPSVVDNHLANAGGAYVLAGHPEEAVAPLRQYLRRYPNILPAHLMLAMVSSELGLDAEAQKEAGEVLRLNPKFSLEVFEQRIPIKDPAVLERHIAALRKAKLK